MLPPIPSNTILFEHFFYGDYDILVQLTQQRKQVTDILINARACRQDKVDATCQYFDSWRKFSRHLSCIQSKSFVRFRWTYTLFDNVTDHDDFDTSLIFETVCAGIAAIATLLENGEISRALHIIKQVQEAQSRFIPRKPLTIPKRDYTADAIDAIYNRSEQYEFPREPFILAPTLHTGIQYLLCAHYCHQQAKSTLATDTKQACCFMYTSVSMLLETKLHLPYVNNDETCARNEARASIVMAQLLEEYSEIGLAISMIDDALLQEHNDAVIIQQAKKKKKQLETRNKMEFAYQRVPPVDRIEIVFERDKSFEVVHDQINDIYHIYGLYTYTVDSIYEQIS